MKLKKIASLALAGVMAVSMLAGCATKPADSEPTTEPTTNMTEAAIAALDKSVTDKVTFTYSASLENTLQKAVNYIGINHMAQGAITNDTLKLFDDTLSADWYLHGNVAAINKNEIAEAAIKDKSTITYVLNVSDINKGADMAAYTDAAVAKELAKAVENATVASDWYAGDASSYVTYTLSKLINYTDTNFGTAPDQYYYSFDYTGSMAVVKVVDEGAVNYVAAFTLTRTPSKLATPVAAPKV